MTDTKRTVVAGLIIGLLTLAIPFYLQLIGVVPDRANEEAPEEVPGKAVFLESEENKKPSLDSGLLEAQETIKAGKSKLLSFSVVTDQYNATISTLGGGSILNFEIYHILV